MSIVSKKKFIQATDEQKKDWIERAVDYALSDYAWALAAQALGVGHLLFEGSPTKGAIAASKLEPKLRDALDSLSMKIEDNATMWLDEYLIQDAVAEFNLDLEKAKENEVTRRLDAQVKAIRAAKSKPKGKKKTAA